MRGLVGTPPQAQRKCAACEEELQRSASAPGRAAGDASAIVSGGTAAAGTPMPSGLRDFFQPRFGQDFGHVRLHTDTAAAESAGTLDARAYTYGRDIVFGADEYKPDTVEGRRLIAHELTHVLQQGADPALRRKKLTEEQRAADLQSEQLKNDRRLQKAYDNSPLMYPGEVSDGVKTLQRALRELNYELPISFAKTGDADGIFGSETKGTVKQFQADEQMEDQSGIVGRKTLDALDKKFLGPQPTCHIRYVGGTLGTRERAAFIQKHFVAAERADATKVLDDLCDVTGNVLSFESEQELRDEVLKRVKISQYLKESQTVGAFAYPESSTACPGKTGNSLADAQVNKAAQDYWRGPILEQRSFIRNRHYYFELTDQGKRDGYQALKKLFVTQSSICDKTLIHCDTLITLIKSLAYADMLGEGPFNERIRSSRLNMWLTYDGMSIQEGGTAVTPVSQSYYSFTPSSEADLVIGDHVIFWNHLAYDAMSLTNPGPWRLENALLVDRDSAGQDWFEGHGAAAAMKTQMLDKMRGIYNFYAKDALAMVARVEAGEPGAEQALQTRYPQVKKFGNEWWIEELARNADRPVRFYRLREITDPNDPELVGLHDPYHPTRMNSVRRPVESR